MSRWVETVNIAGVPPQFTWILGSLGATLLCVSLTAGTTMHVNKEHWNCLRGTDKLSHEYSPTPASQRPLLVSCSSLVLWKRVVGHHHPGILPIYNMDQQFALRGHEMDHLQGLTLRTINNVSTERVDNCMCCSQGRSDFRDSFHKTSNQQSLM